MSSPDDSRLSANPFPGFRYPNGGVEYPQHGFTRRERAAIDLCLPQSGTPWLDDMIRAAQRQRFAAQALTGMLSDPNCSGRIDDLTTDALAYADSLITGGHKETPSAPVTAPAPRRRVKSPERTQALQEFKAVVATMQPGETVLIPPLLVSPLGIFSYLSTFKRLYGFKLSQRKTEHGLRLWRRK